VKHLKDLVVSGGFLSDSNSLKDPSGNSISGVQDMLADLKRAITEVVECWNIL
jgi:hypothetical protein